MAGGIDISKRKPRQLRNTPALRFTSLASLGILGVCCFLGVLMAYAPGTKRILATHFSEEVLEQERREQEAQSYLMFGGMAGKKSSKGIKKSMQAQEESGL